jgi:hypothetical protein
MKRNNLLLLLVAVLLVGLAYLANVGRRAPVPARLEPAHGVAQTAPARKTLTADEMSDFLAQFERADPAKEPLTVEPKPPDWSDETYAYYLRTIADQNHARRGFLWLDASAVAPEKITRILAQIASDMTGRTANRANAASPSDAVVGRSPPRRGRSPEWRPTFPIGKGDVLRYIDENVSNSPGSVPIAGVEINGVFILSNSDGPRDDFSSGLAVVAATGQIIQWDIPDEDARKSPPPVTRESFSTRPGSGNGGRGSARGGGGP